MELYEKNGNILYILHVLKKYTDEEHKLSISELRARFHPFQVIHAHHSSCLLHGSQQDFSIGFEHIHFHTNSILS